jgi:hypothetical protein
VPPRSSHGPSCACLSRRAFFGGFVAFAGSLPLGRSASAQSELCPSERAAIVVRPRPRAPTYDHSLAVADLARISAARMADKSTLTRHGQRPAGLTTADFETQWLITLSGRRRGTRSCMRPARVEVDVRIDSHKIYVARDATQVATCRREVVLEHENRHAKINMDCVEDAKRRIEQALAAYVPTLPTFEGEDLSPQTAGERYKQMLAQPIRDAFQGALADANAKHAAMDSAEAYRRDWSRCS